MKRKFQQFFKDHLHQYPTPAQQLAGEYRVYFKKPIPAAMALKWCEKNGGTFPGIKWAMAKKNSKKIPLSPLRPVPSKAAFIDLQPEEVKLDGIGPAILDAVRSGAAIPGLDDKLILQLAWLRHTTEDEPLRQALKKFGESL